MSENSKDQTVHPYPSLLVVVVACCCIAMLYLASCAMKVQGKISEEESLFRSSTMVNSMPLVFKDAMDKNRKVGKLTRDFWERSEINEFLHIKIYRDQNNVVWRNVYQATGSIQKEDGDDLTITMRGLYFADCKNIQKDLVNHKDVSNIQVNSGRVEYEKTCQNAPDNTIVYKQKLRPLKTP